MIDVPQWWLYDRLSTVSVQSKTSESIPLVHDVR